MNGWMNQHQLNHVQVIKYLWVSIAHDLRWDTHNDNTIAKANRSLGFLRRNLNIGNSKVKQQAYFSLVRPVLEYAATIWHPYTDSLTKKLEMVQRRAARYTLHRYRRTSSVGAMLEELKWKPCLKEEESQVSPCSIRYTTIWLPSRCPQHWPWSTRGKQLDQRTPMPITSLDCPENITVWLSSNALQENGTAYRKPQSMPALQNPLGELFWQVRLL